jgi:hypothetical protein
VRTLLRPQGTLAVIDSAWTEARRPYRERQGFERRGLPDGRAFRIRKTYLARDELEPLLERHGFDVQATYAGKVFIGVVAGAAHA